MAKLPHSAVVLRFRLGSGLVKARQRYADTSRAIVQNVALVYADNEYDRLRKTLEQQVEADVRTELVHLAYLFRRHIVGAAGTRSTPSGTLDTVTKGEGAPTMPLSSGLPPWAPRNAEYLRQKRQATGHVRWFDNRGWRVGQHDARYASRVTRLGRPPSDTGLLFESMRADTWETIFGPISVRFYRKRQPDNPLLRNYVRTSTSTHTKVQVGTIYVRALGRLTPSMLPGYTTGTVRANASGNEPLMTLIGSYDRRLAYRLGRMRNGIYRPTLEPFLGFFLTKAQPVAVAKRISKTTLGSIVRGASQR